MVDCRRLAFADAVTLNPRVTLKRGQRYPHVGMADVDPNSHHASPGEERVFKGSGSRFQHGDTLMARITPCLENGKIARFKSNDETKMGFGSTEFIVIRGRDEVTDDGYAYYLTRSPEFRGYAIGAMTGTSGRQRVPAQALADFVVNVPPLSEQRRIAHILGTLDDKIELNRRMNETLEEMARAIFKDWFVDFGPVRAKLEGREAYLPEEIWRLFPDQLVESELGEVPEGWWVVSLKGLLMALNDRVGDADVPEYSCTNTGLHPRADRFNKRLSTSKSKNKLIRDGDLVFGLSRQILNFGLMRDEAGCVSPAYKVFRVDRDIIEPDLLERIMRLKIDYYYGAVSASSREGQSISVAALEDLRMVCPPKEVQLGFYRLADNFKRQTERLATSAEALSGLQDALLPGLVSGEVGVHDADKMAKYA